MPVLHACRLQVAFHISNYSMLYILSVPAISVCRYKPLLQVTYLCICVSVMPVLCGCRLQVAFHISNYSMFYKFSSTNHLCRLPYLCICVSVVPVLLACGLQVAFQISNYSMFYIFSIIAIPVCRYKPLVQASNLCIQ